MRKHLFGILVAGSLAGCAGGVAVVASLFDAINSYTLSHCGYTFATATIDAVIKAFGGQPIGDVIGSFLCTQARQLVASQPPKPTGAVAPTGQNIISLGTVLVNGKLIPIQILR